MNVRKVIANRRCLCRLQSFALIPVAELGEPDLLIEVDAVAVLP